MRFYLTSFYNLIFTQNVISLVIPYAFFIKVSMPIASVIYPSFILNCYSDHSRAIENKMVGLVSNLARAICKRGNGEREMETGNENQNIILIGKVFLLPQNSILNTRRVIFI